MKKPKFKASSAIWLYRIYEDCVRYDRFGDDDSLRQAPSDVLDGWALQSEVSDLVRRRILYTVPVDAEDQTIGNKVTWGFTDRGIKLMRAWRAGEVASVEAHAAIEPCCPSCGEPLAIALTLRPEFEQTIWH